MKKFNLRNLNKVFFSFLIIISFLSANLFCETAEPYKDDEFPQVFKDLRRAEIITLGSMPFITFTVSLGWSFGRVVQNGGDFGYFVNPFSKSTTSNFTTDEQVGIILTSLGISAGIGLTDFIYHIIKRNQKTKKVVQQSGTIIINPVTEDKDAVKLEKPDLPPPPDDNNFTPVPIEPTEDIIEISEE